MIVPRSAGFQTGFQTCCIADFQSADCPNSPKPLFRGAIRVIQFSGGRLTRSAGVLIVAVRKQPAAALKSEISNLRSFFAAGVAGVAGAVARTATTCYVKGREIPYLPSERGAEWPIASFFDIADGLGYPR